VTVLGVVEAYKLVEVVAPEGVLFEGEVGVCPQVVDPEFSRPGFLPTGFLVEEENVCFDAR
jgi:hypothetical protein